MGITYLGTDMQIVIKHELNRIKNGWAAKAIAPFERSGNLGKELEQMGLQVREVGEGLTVALE